MPFIVRGTQSHATLTGVTATNHHATAPVEVPAGIVAFFSGTCPTGWSELTAARGRYLVGTPESGTADATVGQALTDSEDRQTGEHTHVFTGDALGTHGHAFTGNVLSNHLHAARATNQAGNTDSLSGATFARLAGSYRNATVDDTANSDTLSAVTAGTPAGTNAATGAGTPAGTNANAGAVASTNAPYLQLTCCEKD